MLVYGWDSRNICAWKCPIALALCLSTTCSKLCWSWPTRPYSVLLVWETANKFARASSLLMYSIISDSTAVVAPPPYIIPPSVNRLPGPPPPPPNTAADFQVKSANMFFLIICDSLFHRFPVPRPAENAFKYKIAVSVL